MNEGRWTIDEGRKRQNRPSSVVSEANGRSSLEKGGINR